MIIYFHNKKFKVKLDDLLNISSDHSMNIILYKRYLWIFYKRINGIKITLDDNYKFNFPAPLGHTLITHNYLDNPKTYNENIDTYINLLFNTSFQLEDVCLENFKYKSYFREQRFKKLMKN